MAQLVGLADSTLRKDEALVSENEKVIEGGISHIVRGAGYVIVEDCHHVVVRRSRNVQLHHCEEAYLNETDATINQGVRLDLGPYAEWIGPTLVDAKDFRAAQSDPKVLNLLEAAEEYGRRCNDSA